MDLSYYAINDGYVEAIVRGLRSNLISEALYNQMKSCNSAAELKAMLEETDYQQYLVQDSSDIQISVLRQRLKKKLADEFEYMAAQAVQPLSGFLHLIMCKYMIENVVNIIEGLKNKVDIESLLANADPLGYFPELRSIKVLDGDDYTGLYRDVLIDTPVGPYFMRFLEDSLAGCADTMTMQDIMNIFKEMKPEFIRTSLKKMWLEDFQNYCQKNLSGESRRMMLELVDFEADMKTLQVIYNSIGNKEMSSAPKVIHLRKQLCPAAGLLYPDVYRELINMQNIDVVRESVKGFEVYYNMLRDAPDPNKKEEFAIGNSSLDDIMYNEGIPIVPYLFRNQEVRLGLRGTESVRRILRLPETQGTGDQKHHLAGGNDLQETAQEPPRLEKVHRPLLPSKMIISIH